MDNNNEIVWVEDKDRSWVLARVVEVKESNQIVLRILDDNKVSEPSPLCSVLSNIK